MTEAVLDLCDQSRGMFTRIFSAPTGMTVDLTDLQTLLCTVNFTQIPTEWEKVIDFNTVQLKVKIYCYKYLKTEFLIFFLKIRFMKKLSLSQCSNRNENKMIKFTANFEINIQNYELYTLN